MLKKRYASLRRAAVHEKAAGEITMVWELGDRGEGDKGGNASGWTDGRMDGEPMWSIQHIDIARVQYAAGDLSRTGPHIMVRLSLDNTTINIRNNR